MPRQTEEQWLTAAVGDLDIYRLARGQHRKLRLFAVACCRHAFPLDPDDRYEGLADAAERFADGLVTWDEVKKARRVLTAIRKDTPGDVDVPDRSLDAAAAGEAKHHILDALDRATQQKSYDALGASREVRYAFAGASRPDWHAGCARAERELADLARDIFGNPFRPIVFDPEWRTSTAVALAKTMYQARDFGPMPILADALQDAGCEDPDILAHCRDPDQPHVRGCWVVDLVLGRS
jgi:hypothetical protein